MRRFIILAVLATLALLALTQLGSVVLADPCPGC